MKRCTEISPSCKQPAKRAATEIHGKTSAKQLFFEEKPAQKNGGDHEEPMEGDSLTFLRLKNTEETEELTTQVGVRDQDLQVDQVNDKQIMGVLNSKPPFNVAEIIRKYCPKVLSQQPARNCADDQAPVVQRLDNFIQWISFNPTVSICAKVSVFPRVQANMHTLTKAKFGSIRKPWTTFNMKYILDPEYCLIHRIKLSGL